jgi:hypothetical protein
VSLIVVLAYWFGAALFAIAQTENASATPDATALQPPVTYPAPAGESLLEDFKLTVGGKSVPVYVCRVSAMPFNQVWPGYQRPLDQTELASFAYWDMSSPVDVEIVSHRSVDSVAIRPTARGIRAQVDGNRIRFQLPSPQQITVEVNGRHKALHLFANPPAVTVATNAPGVRYFGPGVHRPGKIVIESNETVYLAGGAVVYGCIEAVDATNIKILGPGILDSGEFERIVEHNNHEARCKSVTESGGCVHLLRCKNVTIDGPILRDPNVWCLGAFVCSDLHISNVKLIGLWRYNSDGIDICNSQNVTVRHSFVRSYDDSLVVKGLKYFADVPVSDVLFEDCVVWNDWGRALEIGAETSAPEISHITFCNCDIIHPTEIAVDIQHSDRAPIKDVLFDKIRVEIDEVNIAPRIQRSRDDKFVEHTNFHPRFLVLGIVKTGCSHDGEQGMLQNVLLRDCALSGEPLPASTLRGFDAAHNIQGVTIINLRINGKVVTSLKEAGINVGPFVSDVRIAPHE